ncbi:twin-arginine pre-protein translocation pathway protein [Fictibacillus macauensis ZFHKF-1]|uniref:Sec-independent protein translocase protein TatC n=1 Tax=Fictibacillus macauensis ZFHKF-1 TaxID=1196324 RepID=I8UHY8_9BACL|nr:twin-arginine translocase subunit TatC [Fictibacillus macauensis]EIT86443.1 twin-arginine pre-protein translocation pathway protein [Fictibacillus macauensis ZFHKF-1]
MTFLKRYTQARGVKKEMVLIGHITELRKRLLITCLCFFLFLVGSFLYVQDIYDFLVRDLHHKLALLSPTDVIWLYMLLACIVAVACTIPVAAFQLWLFISPALSKHEARTALRYIPALFLLFIGGLAFGYFVVYPMILQFLLSITKGRFEMLFTASYYFQFMLNITLPFAFLFEIPLITMFLTSLRIIQPQLLRKFRKIAYFLLIATAVLITPPDFVSDFIVTIPLLFLYEVSIILSQLVHKKKQRSEETARRNWQKTS